MTPLKEIKNRLKDIFKKRKLLFSMNNVTRITGLSRTRLNYWQKKGYIHSLRHERNRNRVYNYPMLVKIQMIQSYLKSGYTLESACKKASKGEAFGIFVHDIVKNRVQQINSKDDRLIADFGPLANDKSKHVYFIKESNGKIIAKVK